MALSRRRFLQMTGTSLCAGAVYPALTLQAATDTSQPLPIPPLLEYRHGRPVFLTLQSAHWVFSHNGLPMSVWGVNGRYLGPTVRVKRGDNVKLIYSNRLDEPVSMRVQGLRVPGVLDGGPKWLMNPHKEWAPIVPIRQAASTCWYHADTQGKMAEHVYRGLAGLWLIDDEYTRDLRIPKQYGVDDIPLILQDKRFSSFGEPKYDRDPSGFVGNTLLVNGVQNPFLSVARGWVRLRVVNASNARHLLLQMSDGRSVYVIAGDAGLLNAPVEVKSFTLAPGERREILVDMNHGEEVTLTAGESAGLMDRLKGLFESSTILVSSQVLTLRPEGLQALIIDELPSRLPAEERIVDNIVRTRTLRLGSAQSPGVNSAVWDQARVDIDTQLGVNERWIVHASTPQSFTVHGAMFRIQSVDGQPPKAEDAGWKDTVWVDNEVELLVHFDQAASADNPFRYHSGILEMADSGTMGQFTVSP